MSGIDFGAFAQAASSIIGGGLGLIGQHQASQDAYGMANDARSWQLDMWDRENRYNTPAAQKQRLIDAGLSPSLMYQTMPQNTSQGTGAPVINTDAAKIKGKGWEMMANAAQNIGAAVAQAENIRADTALKEQEYRFREQNNPDRIIGTQKDNELKSVSVTEKELSNAFRAIENAYGDDYFRLRNKGMNLNAEQLAKAITYMDTNQSLFVREKLATIQQLAASTKNLDANTAKAQIEATRTQIMTELDKMELEYRAKGMSFHDSLLFRELKSTFMNLFSGISNSAGKNNNENTIIQSAAKAILDLITK